MNKLTIIERHHVEAAVEMANEGLGFEALVAIIHDCQTRVVERGFMVATPDGPLTVQDTGDGWKLS